MAGLMLEIVVVFVPYRLSVSTLTNTPYIDRLASELEDDLFEMWQNKIIESEESDPTELIDFTKGTLPRWLFDQLLLRQPQQIVLIMGAYGP